MILGRDCEQKLFSMLHLCVCLDLLQFVSLLTIYAVDRNLVAYCRIHLWVTNQSLQTGQNDSVMHFEVAFVVC